VGGQNYCASGCSLATAIGSNRIPARHTIDDYIANTLETWAIVDEGKGLTRQQMAMIARFKQAYPDNASDMRMADYTMKLTEKDEQLMYLLADEIQCAKDLKALPAAKRLAYYNKKVPPIKEKEAQVMKEWFEIATDAKANGVPLPAYLAPQAAQPNKH
jgi:succinate dehydrogenase flavin-adding protein (antitoxin of CptAB toxin-antitoxin module)